jgi:hypothetical protein
MFAVHWQNAAQSEPILLRRTSGAAEGFLVHNFGKGLPESSSKRFRGDLGKSLKSLSFAVASVSLPRII